MIDLKDLRENPDRYRRAAQLKRIDVDIDRLLELDARRRQLDAERQKLTAEKNATVLSAAQNAVVSTTMSLITLIPLFVKAPTDKRPRDAPIRPQR